ncbi:MAG TPA: HAMP domain-containing sensor histidine kinase, partial [Pirellulales bacterium]|nr:HAMP domain-containing sensor histidine kinase [Pirellulales bacterium]
DVSQKKLLQRRNAEFVSAVSHEMKTPLAGIKAYVELLVDGDAEDAETQDEFLLVINSQTDRLQGLVDNLLKVARIEAGLAVANQCACPLNELLAEALHGATAAAAEKQIVVESQLSPASPSVWGDRELLVQAAAHLLGNAIKYTPTGGHVVLRSRAGEGQSQFEIEDTGVGLCAEDCIRVFEKFYRVEKDKDMAAGTGLGLPLTKHLIEDLHRGWLNVASVLGQGSVFTVTLPDHGPA